MTTSGFAREPKEYASHIASKIILIDGDQLCD
ncbi:restriction endonuclease [Chitinasiproducens palmae]|nr:restriction endonuclease [Chitinasiproducens palmae]